MTLVKQLVRLGIHVRTYILHNHIGIGRRERKGAFKLAGG